MLIRFHRNFEKKYLKLNFSQKEKLKERLGLFVRDEFDLLLNNHPLKGVYKGYRSINITGDMRVIYRHSEKDVVVFVAVGKHSELYK